MLSFGLTIVRHGETQYNKDKLLQGQGIDAPLSEMGIQQAEAAGRYLRHLKFTNVFVSDLQRARQTASIIVRNNLHCSGTEIVSDPLLKERVSNSLFLSDTFTVDTIFSMCNSHLPVIPDALFVCTFPSINGRLSRPGGGGGDDDDLSKSFGVAEGRPVEDMKKMARAAGMSCPDFTPPEGETPEQVKLRIKDFLAGMFQRMVADHGWDGPGMPDEADGPYTGLPDDGLCGLSAHALVVSHGAYMRVAVRYLVEDLRCSVPCSSKPSQLFSACPNTGMCRFLVVLDRGSMGLAPAAIRCIFVNRKDHLKAAKEDA